MRLRISSVAATAETWVVDTAIDTLVVEQMEAYCASLRDFDFAEASAGWVGPGFDWPRVAGVWHTSGMGWELGLRLAAGRMLRWAAVWVWVSVCMCGAGLGTASRLAAQTSKPVLAESAQQAEGQGAAAQKVAPVAGEGAGSSVPTLHAYSNLVQIPTLVLDEDRRPMARIAERRFFVSLDGGPPFRVTHARLEGDDPISLAIVLDVSQPFPTLMGRMEDAIAGMAPGALRPADHVSVYSLDCKLVRAVNDVAANGASLKRAVQVVLEAWRAHGRQRWSRGCKQPMNLWDSLGLVTEALKGTPGRRVILVGTDGEDRGSKTSPAMLRQMAVSAGVAIFGLVEVWNPMRGFRPTAPENIFNGVCELTGGMVLQSEKKDLDEALRRFTALLRGRYIVEFPHPVDTQGGWHGMNITIEKADAFIRPAGISVPVDDAAILNDPTTIRNDPADAPALGKRKILQPR